MDPITVKVTSNTGAFVAELFAAEAEIKERAMVRAINKMADQVKVQAARAVKDAGYGIKVADIKRGIQVRYASSGNLRASVVAKGRPIPLMQYGARQVSKGVSVQVKSGRKVIAGAFIARMPSGHQGVYVREANARHKKVLGGNKPGWHALPIRELFGPSVPDGLANKEVQDAMQRLIVEKFPAIFQRESAWLMRKAGR